MKKKKDKTNSANSLDIDAELLRMYMMGAANPSHSYKNEMYGDTIDLHVEKMQAGKGNIPPQDVLFHQLEEFETALDKAIAAGKFELRVVHGLGKGKLKEEIHKLLAKHPHVKRYSNDYHSRYGFGSTIIHFY